MEKECFVCGNKFSIPIAPGRSYNKEKYCKSCRAIGKKNTKKKYYLKNKIHWLKEYSEQRKKLGNVVLPESELVFYNYKEPLKRFNDGYGYYGVVLYNKEKDKIQCHFCGKLYRAVGTHAGRVHGIGGHEYKMRVGLQFKTALVGEGTREKMIEGQKSPDMILARKRMSIKSHMKMMENLRMISPGKSRQGFALEKRNVLGSCPEQIIDKIKKLQLKLGRRPTAKEYRKEYNGGIGPIKSVYGGWENALKISGFTTHTEERIIRNDSEFLISSLKDFWERYRRVPTTSDMNRKILPSVYTYIRVFGSLNVAREAAGIPTR